MKHLFLILTILVVSILTTACINNFAVQELNNNAKAYLNKGDVNSAICRLKSSIELDSQVWETHYNLALAYSSAKEFENADKEFASALKLNPEFTDIYYSIAVNNEQEAEYLQKNDDDDTVENKQDENKTKLSEKELNESIIAKLTQAVENYKIFLEKTSSEKDKTEIKEKVAFLEKYIQELKDKEFKK